MRGLTDYTEKVNNKENAIKALAEIKNRIAEIKKTKKVKAFRFGTNIVECSESYIKEYEDRFNSD